MLNTAQQKAVDSNADKILVLAGAGTGKTHTMISRISRLVDNGATPNNILVLTFTNAAALEMKTRYIKLHENQAIPTFCTFHAFCYSLIVKDETVRRAIGYNKVPTIPDNNTLKWVESIVRQQCGTRLSNDKLHGKVQLTMKEQFQYDIFWKQFEKQMKAEGYITFDTMCYSVCKLFKNKQHVSRYLNQYKYIFVDEFQDTDPKQWEFVSSFTDSNLFIVGDAKQCIYSFRGADSSIIKKIAQDSSWETIKLSQNYRSTSLICEYSNKIHAEWADMPYNLQIKSDKAGGNVIKHSEKPFDFIATSTGDIISIGDNCQKDVFNVLGTAEPGESLAILCRTNSEVKSIQQMCDKCNVPYRSNHTNRETVDILQCAVDSNYCAGWLVGKLPEFMYNEYVRLCAIDSKLESEEEVIYMYSNRLNKYIRVIMHLRSILNSDKFIYEIMTEVCEYLKIPRPTDKLEDESVDGLVKMLIDTLNVKTESDMYIGTIHSVKGLEFDVVHLIGVGGKAFPVKGEDQKNLFYVGCTRAKRSLHIWFED